MPYPSNHPHPLRRWLLTIALSAAIFFSGFGLVNVLTTTDAEADRAHLLAERAALKAEQNRLLDLADRIHQQNLCGVLAYLVDRSNASLSGIEYYKEHPDELRQALENNAETLRLLDCEPIVPGPPVDTRPPPPPTPREHQRP
jgi:hypothetical protein